MSIENIYYITLILLAIIGWIGLEVATTRKDAEIKKQSRRKYFVYLLLIGVMLVAITLGPMAYTIWIGIISVLCIYELWGALLLVFKKRRWFFGLCCILIYLLMFAGFVFSARIGLSTLLFMYANVVVFDAFSQVIGQLFGKRKMVPKISPGKTWEGLLGGAVIMALVFWVLREFSFTAKEQPTWLYFFVLAAAISGDLFASAIKRRAGIKDFSALLPGQGGFMDRYDSLIFVTGFYMLWEGLKLLSFYFSMANASIY